MEKDKTMIQIEDLLKSNDEGFTISEIAKKTGLARQTILSRLNHLNGADRITIKQINMAKIHKWKDMPEKHSKRTGVQMQELAAEHITPARGNRGNTPMIDMTSIKEQVMKELGSMGKKETQIAEQRAAITTVVGRSKDKSKPALKGKDGYIKTGVPGLDELFSDGIPKGYAILVAGGAGSGKTLLCLRVLSYHAEQGKNCLYMSFEESVERLTAHMDAFGWGTDCIKKGNLMIKRFNPFEITRSVDALLMKAKGELLIDVDPIIFPENFKPDIIVVDSLTAIASAFIGKEDSYRIYIEQLFRFFEKAGATAFMVTETQQIPTIYSTSGVEEFLADGVIVLYNMKHGNVRENAIEVLKLRGAKHVKKIVAMSITEKGVVVYPEQEVFGGVDKND